ncbi:MAG: phosphoadenosine phosphosulfate reductase family protein [Nitrospinae bacterium]|nr:phosphoadenosine phosphosulfate reductase family protein [Nitrospinota bacterium]
MIIHFSGGKDSLAVLHLYKDKDVIVHFVDTGAVYPHVVEFVHDICKKWKMNLKVIKPKMVIEDYHKTYGLPSDMVPTERSPEKMVFRKADGEQKIQSHMQCCLNMVWLPMRDAILAEEDKRVIRGIKKCDEHGTVPDGHVDEFGIQYFFPIWDWSDQDVFDYLKKNNVSLPKHYEQVNSSFDCWLCTAHLASPTAKGRIEWTRKNHYKDLWPELKRRFQAVRRAVEEEQKIIDRAMQAVPLYSGVQDFQERQKKLKEQK